MSDVTEWHKKVREEREEQATMDTDPRYCYDLQVWMINGVILDCNHPKFMKLANCCNAHKLVGEQHNCPSDH